LEKSQIIILTGIAFSLVFSTSLQNVDAQKLTISCPQSSGNFDIVDNDGDFQTYWSYVDCYYERSTPYPGVAGSLRAIYLANEGASHPNYCGGNLIHTDLNEGTVYSATHVIRVDWQANGAKYGVELIEGAKSLMRQLESKNVAISCKIETQTQLDSAGIISNELGETKSSEASVEADEIISILQGLFILFVLPLILIAVVIKKVRARRRRKREQVQTISDTKTSTLQYSQIMSREEKEPKQEKIKVEQIIEEKPQVKTSSPENGGLRLKGGVDLSEMSENMTSQFEKINEIFRKHSGKNGTITSGLDGKHMAGSKHYSGEAVDLRSYHLNDEQTKNILKDLKNSLGNDYDVVDETKTKSPHIHIEYDPIE